MERKLAHDWTFRVYLERDVQEYVVWSPGAVQAGDGDLQGVAETHDLDEVIQCVEWGEVKDRLGHGDPLPAQGQAQVGDQCLPTGWLVARGLGLGHSLGPGEAN